MRPHLGICGGAVLFVLVSCSSSNENDGSNTTSGGASASGGSHASGGTGGAANPTGGSANPSGGSANPGGGSANPTGGTSNPSGGANPSGGMSGSMASGGNPSAGSTSMSGAGGVAAGSLPTIGGCPIFTADDAWNTPVTNEAVDTAWTTKLQALVGAVNLHPDYGGTFGIPINVVPATQTKVTVAFDEPDESDKGPYAFPDPGVAQIEGGTPAACDGDCHLLTVQQGSCLLFEGDACGYQNSWSCYSGAIFDLTKNSYGQRTKGFTSADAAGLSIAAGLIRYDEAAAGAIHHAIRFTVQCTLPKYVTPASHEAVPGKPPGCATNANAVPMGLRVRLDPGVTVKNASKAALAVITAMQTYGMILADNGSPFFFQGEVNPKWDDAADIEPLKQIPASAFKVVQVPPLEP